MWVPCSIVKAVICELEEEHQLALLMLAVLPGTFTLEAAEDALGFSGEHCVTSSAMTCVLLKSRPCA